MHDQIFSNNNKRTIKSFCGPLQHNLPPVESVSHLGKHCFILFIPLESLVSYFSISCACMGLWTSKFECPLATLREAFSGEFQLLFLNLPKLFSLTLVGVSWESSLYSFPKMEFEIGCLRASCFVLCSQPRCCWLSNCSEHFLHRSLVDVSTVTFAFYRLRKEGVPYVLLVLNLLTHLFAIYCILDFRSSIYIFLANRQCQKVVS